MNPAALHAGMIDAQLVEKIRRELDRVELELRCHPYLDAHEAGRLRCDYLTRFAAEQGDQIPTPARMIVVPVMSETLQTDVGCASLRVMDSPEDPEGADPAEEVPRGSVDDPGLCPQLKAAPTAFT